MIIGGLQFWWVELILSGVLEAGDAALKKPGTTEKTQTTTPILSGQIRKISFDAFTLLNPTR